MGLLVIITATISGATISSGSAGYVAVFLDLPPTAIIVGVVLLMGAVACLATTQSIAVAGLMTLVEVGGLLVIIGAGMTEGTANFARLPELIPSPGEGSAWMALGGTTLIAVFAFVGFEHIVNVAEEIKNPGRTLPRALLELPRCFMGWWFGPRSRRCHRTNSHGLPPRLRQCLSGSPAGPRSS